MIVQHLKRRARQQNLRLYLSYYIFKLLVRGGSSIMDVAFGLILSKVTTGHDLVIILYTNINNHCTETIVIIASTFFIIE